MREKGNATRADSTAGAQTNLAALRICFGDDSSMLRHLAQANALFGVEAASPTKYLNVRIF
jgi:hypothetical protein